MTAVHPALRTTSELGAAERALLDRRLYAVLATEQPDGAPHLAPVMFLIDGERILVETGSTTRKARNVAANGRAMVLVSAPEAAWVAGSGPAHVLTGPGAADVNRRIRAKYLTDAGEDACGGVLAALDDATVVVTPTRWLAWDSTALMESVAADGADLAQAHTWFRE